MSFSVCLISCAISVVDGPLLQINNLDQFNLFGSSFSTVETRLPLQLLSLRSTKPWPAVFFFYLLPHSSKVESAGQPQSVCFMFSPCHASSHSRHLHWFTGTQDTRPNPGHIQVWMHITLVKAQSLVLTPCEWTLTCWSNQMWIGADWVCVSWPGSGPVFLCSARV